ncbi:MAG: hypothetical protein ACU83N_06380 [Gammaproteobacteria bacterium]
MASEEYILNQYRFDPISEISNPPAGDATQTDTIYYRTIGFGNNDLSMEKCSIGAAPILGESRRDIVTVQLARFELRVQFGLDYDFGRLDPSPPRKSSVRSLEIFHLNRIRCG